MAWGYTPPKIIENYHEEFIRQVERQQEILQKAGTLVQTGRYNNHYYIKTKRNGDYTISTMYSSYPNPIKPTKIAEKIGEELKIIQPKDWSVMSMLQLTELAPRTLGYDHAIIRQDGLRNWPETKVRLDKPIYINTKTNELYQKDKLKKRVFDRKLKKRYKDFYNSFAFEFKVLAKMKHFSHYIHVNDSHDFSQKIDPIKIKSVEYKQHRWGSPNLPDCIGLIHPKWFTMQLTNYDRMQLATFTMFEFTRYWYSQNKQDFINDCASVAERLAKNPWQMFSTKAKNEEKLQRYLGIATYEEQQ